MSETDKESSTENVADKETIIKVLGILENIFVPSKFNIAKKEIERTVKDFERETGFKAPTYEENRQIYRDNLADDLKKLREPAIEELRKKLLDNCEINPNWSFDNVDNSEASEDYISAYEFGKEWVRNYQNLENEYHQQNGTQQKKVSPGSLIYIYGNFGVGKSMLAGSITRLFVETYVREACFKQWATLYSYLFNLASTKDDSYFKYLNYINTVDLLVIDELAVGKVGLTDNQRKLFGNIIRSRSNQGKNTILVSNSTPYELKELIGEFAFESIKTYSSICPIELKGHNRRARNSDVLSSHGFGD
jgi:DNA replication protein DnaC